MGIVQQLMIFIKCVISHEQVVCHTHGRNQQMFISDVDSRSMDVFQLMKKAWFIVKKKFPLAGLCFPSEQGKQKVFCLNIFG